MKFDIIFLDPPYKTNFAINALKRILELDLLAQNGIVIIETDEEERNVEGIKEININIDKIKKYGRVKLMFLSRKG